MHDPRGVEVCPCHGAQCLESYAIWVYKLFGSPSGVKVGVVGLLPSVKLSHALARHHLTSINARFNWPTFGLTRMGRSIIRPCRCLCSVHAIPTPLHAVCYTPDAPLPLPFWSSAVLSFHLPFFNLSLPLTMLPFLTITFDIGLLPLFLSSIPHPCKYLPELSPFVPDPLDEVPDVGCRRGSR